MITVRSTNCEVRGQLTAENTVGGFVGDNYFNEISNVVSHADIVATKKSAWNGYAAGGIIGVMESAWNGGTGFAKNCVFDGSVKALQDGEEVSAPATVHQIAGKTIADEEYSAGETPKKETRLSGNYTTNNVGSTDATSVDGAYKAAKEMGKDFFTGLEYAYGNTLAEPWKEDGSKIPTLYFNNIAKALAVSSDDVTVGTTMRVLLLSRFLYMVWRTLTWSQTWRFLLLRIMPLLLLVRLMATPSTWLSRVRSRVSMWLPLSSVSSLLQSM